MANASTTHVIEIETGIGEPAFIPLSMGQELQPISVGKKGMWRIESPRVLDVHAFVYFDGSSLFLQSADEAEAASVDGYKVGKAWTELHAPCKIEIGNARLRFRSLIADADNQPTIGLAQPPVQAPPGGPGAPRTAPPPAAGSAPGRGPQTGRPPPVAPSQQPPPAAPSQPVAFPKADRPFKPGEFAAQNDEESTRIAPLESTGANARMGMSGAHPRPAAGAPPSDPSARPEARMMRGGTGAVPAAAGSGPYMGMNQGSMGPGMGMQGMQGMQGAMMQQPGMGYPQQAYGPPPGGNASGAYGAMGPGGMGMQGGPGMVPPGAMSMPPGGFGSMTPQNGMQQPMPAGQGQGGLADVVAKLKAQNLPIKPIAMALIAIAAALFLLDDDEPAPVKKKPVATADAGASSAKTAATTPPVVPPAGATVTGAQQNAAWPPGVPCPPPNWPPNTPLPCTPTTGAPPSGQAAVPTTADRSPPPDKGIRDAGAPLAAGQKTLERQAVDYVAAGETAKAAAAYEELMRREPKNPVYAEAARILRQKLDGGAP